MTYDPDNHRRKGCAMTAGSCAVVVRGAEDTLIPVPTSEPVPGLRVYQLPESLRYPGDDTTHPWRLGHHSGLALAAFPTEDDATRAAHVVASAADWTRSAEALRADQDFDLSGYYDRLMERTNGLIIARDPESG